MALTGVCVAWYAWWKNKKTISQEPKIAEKKIDLGMPFDIPAIKFSLLFMAMIFTSHFMGKYFGNFGVYVTLFFAGFVDVDPTVLFSVETVNLGEMSLYTAQNAIAVAVIVNTIIKLFYI